MNSDIQRSIEFQLMSWWHPGTGRGDGVTADAVAHRGNDHLPFLPGRTVKGLVRDACRAGVAADILPMSRWLELFGTPPPPAKEGEEFERVEALEEGRFKTERGSLRFSSARIGKSSDEQAKWSTWARDREDVSSYLYSHVASTAMDPLTGAAKDRSLRTIEVVVPLNLHAFIEGDADTPWDSIGESIELFLRTLGSHRNRGLGRVAARLV